VRQQLKRMSERCADLERQRAEVAREARELSVFKRNAVIQIRRLSRAEVAAQRSRSESVEAGLRAARVRGRADRLELQGASMYNSTYKEGNTLLKPIVADH
jgi:hypothetical protein